MIEQVIEELENLYRYGYSEGYTDGRVGHPANEHPRKPMISDTAQAIVDLSKHECEWEEVSRIPYHYKTGCGATSNYGPYKLFEQGDKFCPYCDGEIKEITPPRSVA